MEYTPKPLFPICQWWKENLVRRLREVRGEGGWKAGLGWKRLSSWSCNRPFCLVPLHTFYACSGSIPPGSERDWRRRDLDGNVMVGMCLPAGWPCHCAGRRGIIIWLWPYAYYPRPSNRAPNNKQHLLSNRANNRFCLVHCACIVHCPFPIPLPPTPAIQPSPGIHLISAHPRQYQK